jgi:hypothetical protein
MIDIGTMSKNYGLTNEQAKDVEASYQSLSETKRERFNRNDFELLLAYRGISSLPTGKLDLPILDPPLTDPTQNPGDLSSRLKGFESTATLGAAIMALLTKNAAEQRQFNKEIKAAEAEVMAKQIEEQAKDMRDKAIVKLVMGVIAGAVTVIGGAITAGKAGSAMRAGLSDGQAMLTNTKISAVQSAFGGVSTIANTGGEFAGSLYDVKIKKEDAMIERHRQNVDFLKDFNDSLTELIRKSLSTTEAIVESTNQARAKILG